MIQSTQLRPGMIIVHEGDLYRVTAVHHLTPGNKRGFMQTKMKNLRTGVGTEYKFRSEDRVEQAIVDSRQMQYLYAEGDLHTFMDTHNYEQITLTAEDIGDLLSYLLPNSIVGIEFHDGKPVGINPVESVKAASDVNMPLSGAITEVNEALGSAPELVNSDPYGKGWMVKLTVTNAGELSGLMDAAAYQKYCEERKA